MERADYQSLRNPGELVLKGELDAFLGSFGKNLYSRCKAHNIDNKKAPSFGDTDMQKDMSVRVEPKGVIETLGKDFEDSEAEKELESIVGTTSGHPTEPALTHGEDQLLSGDEDHQQTEASRDIRITNSQTGNVTRLSLTNITRKKLGGCSGQFPRIGWVAHSLIICQKKSIPKPTKMPGPLSSFRHCLSSPA